MAPVSATTQEVLSEVSRLPLHAVVELRSPDGRQVFLLGETHVKARRAADVCRRAVEGFSLRGVEHLQRDQVVAGQVLGPVLGAVREALEVLSGGGLAGSTIEVALDLPEGTTVELERTDRVPLGLQVGAAYLALHVALAVPALLLLPWSGAGWLRPLRVAVKTLGVHLYALPLAYALRDRPWGWVIQPLVTILTTRDQLLAEGILRMLETHPAEPAVVIVGRAHVPGVVERLVDQGFRRVAPAVVRRPAVQGG